jgi:hypothetical protein
MSILLCDDLSGNAPTREILSLKRYESLKYFLGGVFCVAPLAPCYLPRPHLIVGFADAHLSRGASAYKIESGFLTAGGH